MRRECDPEDVPYREPDDVSGEPWDGLVADAGPRDHIVQLYQDEDFLNRAICRFACAALANGEGIILVPTLAHWEAIRRRLEAEGVDVDAARESGQLTVVDADEFLSRFMRDAMTDSPVFLGLAADVIGRARAGGRYPKVRWWGEMVNVLWERGDVAASMNLEDLFDQLAEKHGIAIFCSFLMDNFDGEVHARMLPRLGTNHSHLIPVEDYARLERAVADALRETVGPDEARDLEGRLLGEYRPPIDMPRAQALLLALRQVLPAVADPVLQRSRELYAGTGRPMSSQTGTLNDGWTSFHGVDGDGAATAAAVTDLVNILDAVDVPVVVVRRDVSVACFNKAAGDVLGLSRGDVGCRFRDIPVLARQPRLEQQCSEVVTGGVESRVDLRHGDKWFVVRISPEAGSGRRITGAVLTFTNVTAFRASIEQAVYERECTKMILNTVRDPLVVLSADHLVQSGNRAFYTMFGLSRDETHGGSLRELANGAFDSAAVRVQLDEMLAGGLAFRPVEVNGVVTTRGPRTIIVDAHPLSFPGHSERRVLVTFQDITARKLAEAAKDLRSEEELRRSEALLAEGQRLSLTGSFSWKATTDEITWSEQLYRIYGLAIGVPVTIELIRSRVHHEDVPLLDAMVENVRNGAHDLEWRYRLLMPDGSVKYLHAVAHATRDQDRQLEYIAAVQDVTAGRMSEDALAKARSELAKVARVTSLGVLTASIAHEVNQPLSGIITNAGICLRMLDANPPNLVGARETVRRTIRDGNRAADVIKRLRALFSKEELTLESLDLSEVTREVVALSLSDLQRSRVALLSDLADDLPTVTGDRIQLQQVILNLLRNASDAMVDVHDRPRQLLVRTECEGGDSVRVSVRDSGVGVDPQSMNKLLEAFYTTKTDGMGIGLSVSRSIVERHRGRLWAEPNDGPGATFSFSIPSRPDSIVDEVPV